MKISQKVLQEVIGNRVLGDGFINTLVGCEVYLNYDIDIGFEDTVHRRLKYTEFMSKCEKYLEELNIRFEVTPILVEGGGRDGMIKFTDTMYKCVIIKEGFWWINCGYYSNPDKAMLEAIEFLICNNYNKEGFNIDLSNTREV